MAVFTRYQGNVSFEIEVLAIPFKARLGFVLPSTLTDGESGDKIRLEWYNAEGDRSAHIGEYYVPQSLDRSGGYRPCVGSVQTILAWAFALPDTMPLRSPYLLFVKGLAHLVGGEFPEHYDTAVRRRVRFVLGLGTIITTTLAIHSDPNTRLLDALAANAASPASIAAMLSVVAIGFGAWHIASLRRQSLEQHILKTSRKQVLTDDSAEAATDAITLYDYMKVFFVLALLFHLPDIALLIWQHHTLLHRLQIAAFTLQMYYMLLFIDYAVWIGGRWARKYITNDREPTGVQEPSST